MDFGVFVILFSKFCIIGLLPLLGTSHFRAIAPLCALFMFTGCWLLIKLAFDSKADGLFSFKNLDC